MPRSPPPTAGELYAIIRFIRPLQRELARAVETRLEGTGVSVGMRAVLELVLDAGPSTVPQLTQLLGLARQVVQRHVNGLLELQLIEQLENPNHRRSVLLRATRPGRAMFKKIRGREDRVLNQLGAALEERDIAAAHRVLATMHRHFVAQNQSDTTPIKNKDKLEVKE